jgi:hypothetical protein
MLDNGRNKVVDLFTIDEYHRMQETPLCWIFPALLYASERGNCLGPFIRNSIQHKVEHIKIEWSWVGGLGRRSIQTPRRICTLMNHLLQHSVLLFLQPLD